MNEPIEELEERIRHALRICPICSVKSGSPQLCPVCLTLQNGFWFLLEDDTKVRTVKGIFNWREYCLKER